VCRPPSGSGLLSPQRAHHGQLQTLLAGFADFFGCPGLLVSGRRRGARHEVAEMTMTDRSPRIKPWSAPACMVHSSCNIHPFNGPLHPPPVSISSPTIHHPRRRPRRLQGPFLRPETRRSPRLVRRKRAREIHAYQGPSPSRRISPDSGTSVEIRGQSSVK